MAGLFEKIDSLVLITGKKSFDNWIVHIALSVRNGELTIYSSIVVVVRVSSKLTSRVAVRVNRVEVELKLKVKSEWHRS